jgi:hypothetical protein
MFINLSNHPTTKWEAAQINAVPKKYGSIVDLAFPNIPPKMNADDVASLAKEYFGKISQLVGTDTDNAIHLMGETVFVYILATLLLKSGFDVMASTTERIVSYENNSKISIFHFIRFRQFPKL